MTAPSGQAPAMAVTDAISVELPVLFTIAQAAQLLNVPIGWLSKKVSAREVPHTRLGKHVRFTPTHVELIIAAGEQRPHPVAPTNGVSRRARRAG